MTNQPHTFALPVHKLPKGWISTEGRELDYCHPLTAAEMNDRFWNAIAEGDTASDALTAMDATEQRPRWIVGRSRPGEGAPSMSLSYRALTPNLALIAFLTDYPQQSEGTRVDVRMHGADRHDVTATYVKGPRTWELRKPGDALLCAAQDFEVAAAILMHKSNAPVHVLAELLDEASYLRHGDRADLGTLEGAHERYAETSRISRRQTVCRWINASDRTVSTAEQQALNHIGGTGF